jgi:ABC-type protease/lipase transport system fused ATPase/permease subunit
MVLREGTVHMHGPRQQVLQALQEAAQKQALASQQNTVSQGVQRG